MKNTYFFILIILLVLFNPISLINIKDQHKIRKGETDNEQGHSDEEGQEEEGQKEEKEEYSKETLDKMFKYDIKQRPGQSVLNMGGLKVEGDLFAGSVKTRRLMIRQNIKSGKRMEVKKVMAKGGNWDRVMTDQLESLSGQIDVQGDVYISTIQADTLHFDSFIFMDQVLNTQQSQWLLAIHDHFDDQKIGDWEGKGVKGVTNCQQSDDYHLSLSSGMASRVYTLPKHSRVRIQGNIHVFDKWDNHYITATLHNLVFFNQTFNSQPYHQQLCQGSHPDIMFNQMFSIDIEHYDNNLTILFESNIGTNSSYAIDNVQIYVHALESQDFQLPLI